MPRGVLTLWASVGRYLESKLGGRLGAARRSMAVLASSYAPSALYDAPRSEIPAGVEGWGAAGVLDLEEIEKPGGFGD